MCSQTMCHLNPFLYSTLRACSSHCSRCCYCRQENIMSSLNLKTTCLSQRFSTYDIISQNQRFRWATLYIRTVCRRRQVIQLVTKKCQKNKKIFRYYMKKYPTKKYLKVKILEKIALKKLQNILLYLLYINVYIYLTLNCLCLLRINYTRIRNFVFL